MYGKYVVKTFEQNYLRQQFVDLWGIALCAPGSKQWTEVAVGALEGQNWQIFGSSSSY